MEVDFVLEGLGGRVVGIEVKAAATLVPFDFRGISRLRLAAGSAFACGIVLHDGDRIQQVCGTACLPCRSECCGKHETGPLDLVSFSRPRAGSAPHAYAFSDRLAAWFRPVPGSVPPGSRSGAFLR